MFIYDTFLIKTRKLIKSVCVEILRSLPPKEQQEFKLYVFSPFFNKNEKVRQLYSYILCYASDFKDSQLSYEGAYKSIYQDAPYQDARIHNLISDLLQLLYAYLAQYQQREQPMQQLVQVLDALISRQIIRPIPRVVRRIEQIREQEVHQSFNFYQNNYLLSEKRYEYALLENKLDGSESLQEVNDTLDVYYWCAKLRIACEMISRKSVVGAEYNSSFLDTFLQYYEENIAQFEGYPALKVYYQTYFFLLHPNHEKYQALSSLLELHQQRFPGEELRHIYTFLLNYCVRQINFGQTSYYQEILRIYYILIAQHLLLQNGYLTKWTFMNATTAGIRTKEYAWTEQFIQDYKDFLPEKERQNTVDYQLAALYFAKGELEQTLQLLQQVEFTDIFYHASAKLIQLKVYYELEEVEPFYSLVRATLSVIRRSRKLSDYHRASYVNFVKLAKNLHDIKISRKRNISAKLKQVGEKLAATSPLANKGWLLEKYELL